MMPKQKFFWDRLMLGLALGYLLLPFIIFCCGWLRWPLAAGGCLLLGVGVYRMWADLTPSLRPEMLTRRQWGWGVGILLLLAVWCFFSGIGGFSFQNYDHLYRNAIFRDLINLDWPVRYGVRDGAGQVTSYRMSYYIGFWLPAALVGKYEGEAVAQVVLLLWTIGGCGLTVYYLHRLCPRLPAAVMALLLIFWSGMDVVGGWIVSPSQGWSDWEKHLENWNYNAQYSCFTTALYWVFNQALPSWLAVALILNFRTHHSSIYLLLALLAFFAPLPFIGFIPIVLFLTYEDLLKSKTGAAPYSLGRRLAERTRQCFSVPNLVGGVLLAVTLAFFSRSHAEQHFHLPAPVDWKWDHYGWFIVCEFGLLAAVMGWHYRRRPLFYLTVLLLLLYPAIYYGPTYEFGMRASLPALLVLLVFTADFLADRNSSRWRRAVLIGLLAVGVVTPVHEIWRSMKHTAQYYSGKSDRLRLDQLGSLNDVLASANNFITENRGVFSEYLMRRPVPPNP